MAGQADADEELDLDNEEEFEPEPDNQDDTGPDGGDDDAEDQADKGDDPPADEFTLELEEGEPVPENTVVRQLRARVRELEAERRQPEAPKPIELGPKPTMESCGYDEEKFEAALTEWKDQEAKVSAAQSDAQRQRDAAVAAWNEDLATLERQRGEIKVRDFEPMVAIVDAALSDWQRVTLVRAADNKAQLTYALGKHPGQLKRLAEISDPIKFAAQVAKLEGLLKVTTKKKAPPPEETVRGSAPLSSGADKHLEKLEKEAEKTGDRSKIIAYKRTQKANGR